MFLKKKNSPCKYFVDLDMRESKLLENKDKIEFKDIKESEKYRGVITRVESYGVFVRLENSDVYGLAHLSECSDDYIKNLSTLYDPGDLVKVLVKTIDTEKKRVSFSLKASHFEDDEDSDDDSSSESSEEDSDMPDVVSSDDESDGDSDDENFASKLAAKMEIEKTPANEDEEMKSDDNSSDEDGSSSSDDDSDCLQMNYRHCHCHYHYHHQKTIKWLRTSLWKWTLMLDLIGEWIHRVIPKLVVLCQRKMAMRVIHHRMSHPLRRKMMKLERALINLGRKLQQKDKLRKRR